MTRAPLPLLLLRTFRRAALPLAAYYTVTLVLPLANGAARADPNFVRHALIVLLVPAAIVVSMSAARTLFQRAGVFVVTLRTRRCGAATKDTKPIDWRGRRLERYSPELSVTGKTSTGGAPSPGPSIERERFARRANGRVVPLDTDGRGC